MYIAAGGPGLKQSDLAELVRHPLGPEIVGDDLVRCGWFGGRGEGWFGGEMW